MNDGKYRERSRAYMPLRMLNKYQTTVMATTDLFGAPYGYNINYNDSVISYNSTEYYPSFDTSHLPYYDYTTHTWCYGVTLNKVDGNYTNGYYRIYRRYRYNTYRGWSMYTDIIFRPHFFNYIIITDYDVNGVKVNSMVPDYEYKNFLNDNNGTKIHYSDLTEVVSELD